MHSEALVSVQMVVAAETAGAYAMMSRCYDWEMLRDGDKMRCKEVRMRR